MHERAKPFVYSQKSFAIIGNPKPTSAGSMTLRKKENYENCNVVIRKSLHILARSAVYIGCCIIGNQSCGISALFLRPRRFMDLFENSLRRIHLSLVINRFIKLV